MEYDVEKKEIYSNKVLNDLDKFTIDFINVLDEMKIDYVIVSGYVSIILGRTRGSEDVDLLIPKINFDKFTALFDKLEKKGFVCLNTSNVREAYDMWHEHAIRFSRRGMPLPNMEFKMITREIHKTAIRERIKLMLKEKNLYISDLGLQIAYKLSLVAKGNFQEVSSDKDFEDAKHIYEYFKDKLNKEDIAYYVNLLNCKEAWGWLQR